MSRGVGLVLGLVLLVAGVTWPVWYEPQPDGSGGYEDTTITDYRAEFDVAADGTMTVVETITVDFPSDDKHGIFRFFDVEDPNAPYSRRIPRDLSVTRDGQPDVVDLSHEQEKRYLVVRVGDPDVRLDPGPHVYRIAYRMDGVLLAGAESGSSRFYWNLIPGGWQQPVAQARLTVRLPEEPSGVQCAVGVGEAGGCEGRVRGREVSVEVEDLPDHTPVTLAADVALAMPSDPSRLGWTSEWDGVLGQSRGLALVILLLAAAAAAGGLVVSRRVTEEPPAFPRRAPAGDEPG